MRRLNAASRFFLILALILAPASAWAQTSDLDPDDPEYDAEFAGEKPASGAGPSTTPAQGAPAGDPATGQAPPAQLPMTEYVVELVGSHDYWRFKDAREKIQAQIPEGVEMSVRKISRGRIVYGMKARVTVDELLARLGGLPLKRGQLAILGTNENSVRLEIQ